MKNYLAILLILISIQSAAQNIKALDDKYGFREMKFDDSITKFDDLVPLDYSNDSTKILYKRSNDKLTIGATEVTIYYSFYKNLFDALTINVKGYENCEDILNTLEGMYGKGHQSNRYIKDFTWIGKKVLLSYDYDSVNNEATIYMFCNSSIKKQSNDAKLKALKAKEDF